jgi:hypothetical protein
VIFIAFPYAVDGHGRTATTTFDEYAYELFVQTLLTDPGERVNRPSFGCRVRGLVMDPASVVTAAGLRVSVLAVLQVELAGMVDQLDVDADVGDASVAITVTYRLRRTGRTETKRVDIPLP